MAIMTNTLDCDSIYSDGGHSTGFGWFIFFSLLNFDHYKNKSSFHSNSDVGFTWAIKMLNSLFFCADQAQKLNLRHKSLG